MTREIKKDDFVRFRARYTKGNLSFIFSDLIFRVHKTTQTHLHLSIAKGNDNLGILYKIFKDVMQKGKGRVKWSKKLFRKLTKKEHKELMVEAL